MTELETQIWNIVHNWCDAQSKEIPDQNRRYLMDEMKALVLSHVSGSLLKSLHQDLKGFQEMGFLTPDAKSGLGIAIEQVERYMRMCF